jgi:N-acetylgalactosamine-6-sulfatase
VDRKCEHGQQKHDRHEGGARSPFILRWPGYVPAGKTNHNSIISALDWLPTLCRIAEVPIDPAELQGEDVVDIWLGSERSRNREQFWNSSMKQADWRIDFSGGSTTAVELYDLSADISETNNLLTVYPDKVAELTDIWTAWKASLP